MRKKGFTLIEVAIILVILGLIIGLGIPMLRTLIEQNKLTEDRTAVKEAKQALIGYAYAHGGFPSVYIKDGLKLLPYSKLGVSGKDANGNFLIYDVNPSLTETSTGNSIQTFCQNVALEMSKNDYPQIQYPDGSKTPVAFVVVSKSINYRLDDLNVDAAKANNRQAVFDAPQHPYSKNYDDIVAVETLADLNRWCQSSGNQSGTGGGSSGGSGNNSPKAVLASLVAQILNQFGNTPPTPDQLNSILPPGATYRYSRNGRGLYVLYVYYNGSKATILWNRAEDSVKRVTIR